MAPRTSARVNPQQPQQPTNDPRSARASEKQPETTPPPTQMQLAPDDTDLAEIHNGLHGNPYFLGNSQILDHVQWISSGREQKLVVRRSDENKRYESAVLEWVGEISASNFWLYACAGWNGERGPNDDWKNLSPFEKAKARAHVRSPDHPLFANDWEDCITNLVKITDAAKKSNAKTLNSVLQHGEVKIRHSIFEVSLLLLPMIVVLMLDPKQRKSDSYSQEESFDSDEETINSKSASGMYFIYGSLLLTLKILR